MNYLFLNPHFALKLQGKYWKDDVVTFTAHLSLINYQMFNKIQAESSLAAMLEGKGMSPNMTPNSHKMSPLNAFPLKFWV